MGKLAFHLAALLLCFFAFRSLWMGEQEVENISTHQADTFNQRVNLPMEEATDVKQMEEERIKQLEAELERVTE